VGELLRLSRDGRHDPGVGVTHVESSNAASEIDETPSVHVADDGTTGLGNEQRGRVRDAAGNGALPPG
jgi:hypothetical protein